MSSLLPLASYNLELLPYAPEPAQPEEFPVTVRLTLAAIDPEACDDRNEPSTLRILKKSTISDDFYDDLSDDYDEEDEEEDDDEEDKEEDDEDDEEEENEEEEKETAEGEEDEEDDDEDDDESDIEEHVICTLSPTTQFQQTIDFTILPDEEVYFVCTGSYKIHLTGNYVEHPYDEEDDYDESDDEEDDGEYDDDYDLTPDEDEIIDGEDFDLDELDEIEDIEGKIEELVEEENNKKRAIEETTEEVAEEKPAKKSKKEKKEKAVQFNKEIEQGPTPSKKEKEAKAEPKKIPTKTLPGGVVIEDRTVGTGPVAKKGQKVGVRYIGKLKNGKVFDKNVSGKPFNFGLGKGEVIKGWDVGVAGMAVGGERRIVIPAPMAYGSKKLPGIPANSELTFDVKLLSIK